MRPKLNGGARVFFAATAATALLSFGPASAFAADPTPSPSGDPSISATPSKAPESTDSKPKTDTKTPKDDKSNDVPSTPPVPKVPETQAPAPTTDEPTGSSNSDKGNSTPKDTSTSAPKPTSEATDAATQAAKPPAKNMPAGKITFNSDGTETSTYDNTLSTKANPFRTTVDGEQVDSQTIGEGETGTFTTPDPILPNSEVVIYSGKKELDRQTSPSTTTGGDDGDDNGGVSVDGDVYTASSPELCTISATATNGDTENAHSYALLVTPPGQEGRSGGSIDGVQPGKTGTQTITVTAEEGSGFYLVNFRRDDRTETETTDKGVNVICDTTPPPASTDDDGDGVDGDKAGSPDKCANTPSGETVDANGCSASQRDEDGDGVKGDTIGNPDKCPMTPANEVDQVDENGCSPSQLDTTPPGDGGDNGGGDNPICVNPEHPEFDPATGKMTGALPGTWATLWLADMLDIQTLVDQDQVGSDCTGTVDVPKTCEPHRYQWDNTAVKQEQEDGKITDETGDGVADVWGYIYGTQFNVDGDKSKCDDGTTPPPNNPPGGNTPPENPGTPPSDNPTPPATHNGGNKVVVQHSNTVKAGSKPGFAETGAPMPHRAPGWPLILLGGVGMAALFGRRMIKAS